MIMNKFLRTLYIVPLSFLLTGCWTSIYTVSEPVVVHEKKPAPTYVTTVTTSSPKVKTVTTFTVTRYNTDPCFYLDLNAVAAAFAESNSVRDFEQILNSSRYMINNLDLNRDGWIDYLRVLEEDAINYSAQLGLALLCQNTNKMTEALERITLMVEGHPDKAELYSVRASMYAENKQLELAIMDLDKAVELEPENPNYYLSRAYLHKQQGNKRRALADFEAAIKNGVPSAQLAEELKECR